MGVDDDQPVTKPPTHATMAGRHVEAEEALEAEDVDNMPDVPGMDVDEWLPDEAGYGYGV